MSRCTFRSTSATATEHRAYALGDDAGWNPIALDEVLAAASATPVLIETPWTLPRQLVLVHAPAFDSGFPLAGEIVRAAADAASEILALFSRQLSDRELELYGRIAEGGKPMTFVHTMADHEDGSERRNVVMLADRYLRERAIVPQRIFTVSTLEYRAALEAARAPAGWNELVALRATLEAHAEEHMARLDPRRARARRARTAGRCGRAGPRRRSADRCSPACSAAGNGGCPRRAAGGTRTAGGLWTKVPNPTGRVRHLYPRPGAHRARRRHAEPTVGSRSNAAGSRVSCPRTARATSACPTARSSRPA